MNGISKIRILVVNAAFHSLGEMEEVSGVAGLGQILEKLVEVSDVFAEIVADVLELLVSLLIDNFSAEPASLYGYLWKKTTKFLHWRTISWMQRCILTALK
jgi:hypothetical protein